MVYTEASAVGPALRLSGKGAWCVRKSSFVRGSPPKTQVGDGFHPVPRLSSDGRVSPPKPTLEMGQDGVV